MLEFYRKLAAAYGGLGLAAKVAVVLLPTLVTTLFGIVVVVLIPADHFVRPLAVRSREGRHPVVRWVTLAAKNLLGLLILPLGVVMLVGPGPGIVFTLLGLSLLDIPGKRNLEKRLIRRPGVLRTINDLRTRFGRPPIVVEPE